MSRAGLLVLIAALFTGCGSAGETHVRVDGMKGRGGLVLHVTSSGGHPRRREALERALLSELSPIFGEIAVDAGGGMADVLVRADVAGFSGGAENFGSDCIVDVLVLDLRNQRLLGRFQVKGSVGLISLSAHPDDDAIELAAKEAVKKLRELR